MKHKLVAFPYIILSFSSSNITSIKKKNRDMASGIKAAFSADLVARCVCVIQSWTTKYRYKWGI